MIAAYPAFSARFTKSRSDRVLQDVKLEEKVTVRKTSRTSSML